MIFSLGFSPGGSYSGGMPEKTTSDVARNWREQFEKGLVAYQRQNLDYAISLFQQVLQHEPSFYECREALRAAQFKRAGSSTSFFKKAFGAVSSSPLIAKGQLALRSSSSEAIGIAEQVLNSDPHNTQGHKLVADAALAAGWYRTAVLSLEILLKASPHDRDISMKLAGALVKAGQIAKAENIYSQLAQAHPDDAEIKQALKDFSASKTMEEGGYEALSNGQGTYRDALRDKDSADTIEQEHRVVKSEDVAGKLIAEYEARLVKEPNNLKLVRTLAELHTEIKDFDRALEYYARITQSEMGNDPSLERVIADTNLRKLDHEMAQLDPASPDHSQRLEQLKSQRQEFQLNECRRRADRFPTDLQIRFELGQFYLSAGKIGEAIQEFQKSVANPHKRIQAMYYLGQCFAQRRMFDLAARQFETAIKEKPVLDDEKKELHYCLGCALDNLGRKEEAIDQFKRIYEIDIGYKDVAARVDAFYSQP
jgi:tetratricopeptide (TPR) repeat protein